MIWGNALSIHIQSLVKLQNKIVRIITSLYHNTEQLYNNTGILQFKILVTHRIGILMYKLSHGNVPKPIQNLYKLDNNVLCCCLHTPMTLGSGGSPMFPLVVHQPASLASSAVTPAGSVHKSRGDNVGAVEEMMCVVCVDVTEGA